LGWSDQKPLAFGAYALAAALALGELAILWQALHPNVSDDYRAYYIDRTSTCMPQIVSADYTLGRALDFRSGGDDTTELRPCGWEGPAGDGVHAIGTSSRLRLQVGPPQDLTLTVELTATTLPGPPLQRVEVVAGTTPIGTLDVTPDGTVSFTLTVPAVAIGTDGILDLELRYPDAINPGRVANVWWRSIKLSALQLAPTG
jgi:hypothetical protein